MGVGVVEVDRGVGEDVWKVGVLLLLFGEGAWVADSVEIAVATAG